MTDYSKMKFRELLDEYDATSVDDERVTLSEFARALKENAKIRKEILRRYEALRAQIDVNTRAIAMSQDQNAALKKRIMSMETAVQELDLYTAGSPAKVWPPAPDASDQGDG